MNPTIRELTGVPEPKIYTNSKATPLHCADPRLLYGLELEIENVPNWDELVVAGMTSVEDGSLRNNGREFLTSPSTFSVVSHMLERFFDRAKLTKNNYSERCSVHVHANCQDLTTDQLSGLCMLYQVYERLLYTFAGEERDKNIFCIPWDQTMITYNVINNIESKRLNQLKSWAKYTGLNLLPLLTLGTIEFRHMPGTCDINKIKTWLNLIGSLFSYVRNTDLDSIKKQLVELNSTSQYADLTSKVFTSWSKEVSKLPNYQMILEEGVLNMKYSMLKPPEFKFAKDVSRPEQVIENTLGLADDWLAAPPPPLRLGDILAQQQARLQQQDHQIGGEIDADDARAGRINVDIGVIVGAGRALRPADFFNAAMPQPANRNEVFRQVAQRPARNRNNGA